MSEQDPILTPAQVAQRDQEKRFERDFDAHLTGESWDADRGVWIPREGDAPAVDQLSDGRPVEARFTSISDMSAYLQMERESRDLASGAAIVPEVMPAYRSPDFPAPASAAVRHTAAATTAGPRHAKSFGEAYGHDASQGR